MVARAMKKMNLVATFFRINYPILREMIIGTFPLQNVVFKDIFVIRKGNLLFFRHKKNDFVVICRCDNSPRECLIRRITPCFRKCRARPLTTNCNACERYWHTLPYVFRNLWKHSA